MGSVATVINKKGGVTHVSQIFLLLLMWNIVITTMQIRGVCMRDITGAAGVLPIIGVLTVRLAIGIGWEGEEEK